MGVRLLVVQPSAIDPPDRLGEWLTEAGAELRVLEPATEPVPSTPEGFDAVVCLGGEMGAGDDGKHRWLGDVRALLAAAANDATPVLGVCLGGQLLAAATGGAVRTGVRGPESGTLLVAKRDAADGDPLFGPLPMTPDVLQFHHDEIHRLPPGATLLAAAPRYQNQAFRVGAAAYGLQFHIETTTSRVLSWAEHDTAAAAAAPAGHLDPAHLDRFHDELAETWRPFAHRLVALAAGRTQEQTPVPGGRRTLPMVGPMAGQHR